MSISEDVPATLMPSELGTKSYWDECYKRELKNHVFNSQDEGTVWFAETGAEERMMSMLEDMAEAGLLQKDAEETSEATSFIDLGTGNGHLLFSLGDDGWTGKMLGIDYSADSIMLAKQINGARLKSEGGSSSRKPIEFAEHDLMSGNHSLTPCNVLLDKGTFDAISLSKIAGATILYRETIIPLLRKDGYLIITSCNWTETELRGWIEGKKAGSGGWFEFMNRVKYPIFRFGGKEGQTVVTLCFQIKRDQ